MMELTSPPTNQHNTSTPFVKKIQEHLYHYFSDLNALIVLYGRSTMKHMHFGLATVTTNNMNAMDQTHTQLHT